MDLLQRTWDDGRNEHTIGDACSERFLPESLAQTIPGLRLGGISDLLSPYRIWRMRPDFHLLLAVVSGSALLRHDHGHRRLGGGDLLIAPAGSRYAYSAAAEGWRIVWLHVQAQRSWRHLAGPLRVQEACPEDIAATARAMEEVVAENLRPHRSGSALVEARARVIAAAWEDLLAGGAGADPALARLLPVWQRVDAQLYRPWSLDDLAALAGCSVAQLTRDCQRLWGMSPGRRVIALRLARARSLLLQTDHDLSHIAEIVGYSTPFALSAACSRTWGVSPQTLRRQGRSVTAPPPPSPERVRHV